MKKLLLSTATAALAFSAMPAMAEIDLDVGGYFRGYGAVVDQDEATGTEVNGFDFLKDTEIHVTGETTLDNGLTVGFHSELDTDGEDGNARIDESYMYLSSTWGRINFGEEDGAAYLLQVAAPSADSNVDGLRTNIQPVNVSALAGAVGTTLGGFVNPELEYAQDPTNGANGETKTTKITYLTPVISGFQGGISYSPESAVSNDVEGVGVDNGTTAAAAPDADIGETYEVAGRYEGQIDAVGFTLGAGYSHGEQETDTATNDDREVWNVGLDLDFGPFGLGAVYKEDNAGLDGAGTDDEETIVVGADYTTGPFKLGASYASFDNLFGTEDLEAERYTGGVVYTYGPGMTLRGSVQYVDFDTGTADADATSFLLGTQVKF